MDFRPYVIDSVDAPAVAPEWQAWLEEIGFIPGEQVMVMARSLPGGDPLVVRMGASKFALRLVEAACIHVKTIEATTSLEATRIAAGRRMKQSAIHVHPAGPLIALVGNPNCGKTALFNLLTGSRQKVANYAGVTVERKEGKLVTPAGKQLRVLDLPGTYSLHPRSPDERVTCDVLSGSATGEKRPDLVICVDTAFPGPGGRDAFEMATRMVTGGRYNVDLTLAGDDVLKSPKGSYLFRMKYRGRTVDLTLRPGFVVEEFVKLAKQEIRTPAEEERLAKKGHGEALVESYGGRALQRRRSMSG